MLLVLHLLPAKNNDLMYDRTVAVAIIFPHAAHPVLRDAATTHHSTSPALLRQHCSIYLRPRCPRQYTSAVVAVPLHLAGCLHTSDSRSNPPSAPALELPTFLPHFLNAKTALFPCLPPVLPLHSRPHFSFSHTNFHQQQISPATTTYIMAIEDQMAVQMADLGLVTRDTVYAPDADASGRPQHTTPAAQAAIAQAAINHRNRALASGDASTSRWNSKHPPSLHALKITLLTHHSPDQLHRRRRTRPNQLRRWPGLSCPASTWRPAWCAPRSESYHPAQHPRRRLAQWWWRYP